MNKSYQQTLAHLTRLILTMTMIKIGLLAILPSLLVVVVRGQVMFGHLGPMSVLV